jgi:cell division protein FtsW
VDQGLALSVVSLAVAGVVLVFTASFATAGRLASIEGLGDPYRFLKAQVAYGLFGGFLMVVVSQMGPGFFRRAAPWAYGLAVVLLVAVLVFGRELGGSRRWLQIGPITFQPSEFAKLALVLFLARFLSDRGQQLGRFRTCLRALGYAAAVAGLTVVEPDLGTAALLCLIGLLMLFLAGARLWQVGSIALAAGAAVAWVILHYDYMRERMLAFWDPVGHVDNSGYHVIRMLVALATGGWRGTGLGEGVEKWSLPARHTDSIYCVVGEELGVLGCVLLLALFVWFARRAFAVALQAPDSFTQLAAGGLAGAITLQAALNIAVATACLPVTGVTLPFVSSGGSSLAMMLIAAGILLSISRLRPAAAAEPDEAPPGAGR